DPPAARSSRATTRPSILLIVADTLRADRIEATRAQRQVMPFLSRYADTAWSFSRAYVQATWTKPSMASIFTSLDPEVHRTLFGVHALLYPGQPPESDVLPSRFETMAAYFRRHGYRTLGIQTNPNLDARFGFGRGFDTYRVDPYPHARAAQVTDQALGLLGAAGRPFFFYVHYMDTHAPYDPPSPHRETFGALPELGVRDREMLVDYESVYLDRALFETGLKPAAEFAALSEAAQARLRHLYDGGARYLDAEIERLVEGFVRRAPETIVIFTSDHGEELWDHGSVGHAKTLYEELVRVPLIVRVPAAKPARIETPVESLDILPTLAALAGLPASSDWQGRDLRDAFGPQATRPVTSSTRMSIPGSNVDLECVLLGDRKLIHDLRRGMVRTFDLASDPAERSPEVADATRPPSALLTALEQRHRRNREHRLAGLPGEKILLEQETLDSLRALGYLR
ncbi:MAG TPA: sulfatase-like hydrolase/transferase, partial [Thermoanaerobaculia bacterium]|nr:sulfatase-like hydrolase/transferase [Thermoanaerobaculia bacterium]